MITASTSRRAKELSQIDGFSCDARRQRQDVSSIDRRQVHRSRSRSAENSSPGPRPATSLGNGASPPSLKQDDEPAGPTDEREAPVGKGHDGHQPNTGTPLSIRPFSQAERPAA